MFKRRNFFKSLIGLFLVPKVVEAIPLPKETVSYLCFKDLDYNYEAGFIYAPYMPLLTTKEINISDSDSFCKTSGIVNYPAYV